MFFTPGRIVGLLVFLVVLMAIGYALKRLQGGLEVADEPGELAESSFAVAGPMPEVPRAETPRSPKASPRHRKRGR
jgi:hypothetical protein